MNQLPRDMDEVRIEQFLGNLLRAGVILAAVVVLAGGVLFLLHHAGEPADYREFREPPAELRSPTGIVTGALTLDEPALIQFGLLLLIATPVARVVFSALAFAWERDFTYVALTLVVLAVLLYSLFFEKG
jgi:uncharacterized membrane protein